MGHLTFPYPGMGHRVAGGALSQINRKQMSHCIVSDLYSELFPTVQLFRFLNMFPQLFFISDTRSTGVIDYSLSFRTLVIAKTCLEVLIPGWPIPGYEK